MHESYGNSLTLHGVTVEEEHSVLDNNSRPSTPSYNILLSQGNKTSLLNYKLF
jgi:hypothetical protein